MDNTKPKKNSPSKFFLLVFALAIPVWVTETISIANIGRILFPKYQNHNPLVDYPDIHYSIIAIAAVIVIFLWGLKILARYRYLQGSQPINQNNLS